MGSRIYLDHASTTPILPEAADAIRAACDGWANPSSAHAEGRAVRAMMEEARRRIAAALGWDGTLIFTSGATEAIELVMRRAKAGPRTRLGDRASRGAALRAGPGDRGRRRTALLDLAALDAALAARAPLVAVQSVNNETGVIQPIEAIAARVKAADGLLLCRLRAERRQAAAAGGRFHLDRRAQVRRPAGDRRVAGPRPRHLEAIGGQEGGYRPGTAAVPLDHGLRRRDRGRSWLV